MLWPVARRIIAVVCAATCLSHVIVLTGLFDAERFLEAEVVATVVLIFLFTAVVRTSTRISVNGEMSSLVDMSADGLRRFRRLFRSLLLAYVLGVVAGIQWREFANAPRARYDEAHASAWVAAIVGLPFISTMLAVSVLGDGAIRTPSIEAGYPWLYRLRMWWLGKKPGLSEFESSEDDADDD